MPRFHIVFYTKVIILFSILAISPRVSKWVCVEFSMPRCLSGKVSASRPKGFGFETQFHWRSAVYVGVLRVKSHAKRPPACVVLKFGEAVPAQVSPSPFVCGSKLRGKSQNSPRVASKRDVNIN
ncbi:hypothetical protein AVEN_216250-1 [Araneus ventricosus]|uniref:Secreted protein n=1 Tax=Araneus ventricosus TaxID=182803 RepID=A0A4Y2HRB1_ARAVE|nr:hypothetical protein AVEN_216250-1 [Araneus ventricosus]